MDCARAHRAIPALELLKHVHSDPASPLTLPAAAAEGMAAHAATRQDARVIPRPEEKALPTQRARLIELHVTPGRDAGRSSFCAECLNRQGATAGIPGFSRSLSHCRVKVSTGGFLMLVALSRRRPGDRSIKRILPWAGMGLCLALLFSHLVYDQLGRGRSVAAGPAADAPAVTPGQPPSAEPPSATSIKVKDSKFDAARSRSSPHGSIAWRPGSPSAVDPGQRGPAGRGPPSCRGHRARGSCRAGPERQTGRSLGHARQPRDRHRPAQPPRQAARAVDRAVRGRLEVGDRRQCRPPDPRAAKGISQRAKCRRRR